MSAENTETLTFVSLTLCFLGFVNRHHELFFSYICGVLSMNSQVQVLIRSRADEERTPTHCSIIIVNGFKAEFLFMLRCML